MTSNARRRTSADKATTSPRWSVSRSGRRRAKSANIPIWTAVIGAAATITAAGIAALAVQAGNEAKIDRPTAATPSLSSTSSPTPTPSSNSPRVAGDNAAFVRDITYPDGSKVSPGQHFIKEWEIKNTGTVHWTG